MTVVEIISLRIIPVFPRPFSLFRYLRESQKFVTFIKGPSEILMFQILLDVLIICINNGNRIEWSPISL